MAVVCGVVCCVGVGPGQLGEGGGALASGCGCSQMDVWRWAAGWGSGWRVERETRLGWHGL